MSTPFPPCDGIGYHVYSLSKELMRLGHQVTVITRKSKGEEQFSEFDGIKIMRGPFLPIYPAHIPVHRFLTNKALAEKLNDFDLVHYHIPLVPVLRIMAPSVVTVHSSMIEEMNQMESGFFLKKLALQAMTKTFTKKYMRATLKNANATIAVSTSLKDELLKYYGIRGNVRVVPNGVDTEYFHPQESQGRSRYILYVGRLAYRKGLLELLDAFNIVSKDTDASLVLCGKGPLQKVLEGRVKKYGLVDRVKFKGFVTRDELLSLYQNASLFVAASSYETGPLTALEAMSCGTPVIVTKVGIMPDVIKDGDNGLFVNKNDPQDLAGRCLKVLNDAHLAAEMGENARRTVEASCQWKQIAAEVDQIYAELVQNKDHSLVSSS